MEITGRLTANAEVRRTKNNKELVSFTIVDNDRYKTKTGEKKEDATFFRCSYWITTSVAEYLKKGMIVTLSGRVGINSYQKRDGDFIAELTFLTNHIRIVAKGSSQDTTTTVAAIPAGTNTDSKDDLPF
jgi:single-strand DNA-binding protein